MTTYELAETLGFRKRGVRHSLAILLAGIGSWAGIIYLMYVLQEPTLKTCLVEIMCKYSYFMPITSSFLAIVALFSLCSILRGMYGIMLSVVMTIKSL